MFAVGPHQRFAVIEDGGDIYEKLGLLLFFGGFCRTVSGIDSTRLVAALTARSASEMDGVEQCARYNFPTA